MFEFCFEDFNLVNILEPLVPALAFNRLFFFVAQFGVDFLLIA